MKNRYLSAEMLNMSHTGAGLSYNLCMDNFKFWADRETVVDKLIV